MNYTSFYLRDSEKVYNFLSNFIYQELKEFGHDIEYIYPFYLYLNWSAVNAYCFYSKRNKIKITENIISYYRRRFPISDSILDQNGIMSQDNWEIFSEIFTEVFSNKIKESWLGDWCFLCKSCYSSHKYKMRVCISLLTIVNESIPLKYSDTLISLDILLRMQKGSL